MSKLIKNWLVAFVSLFVVDLIWHLAIFGNFYSANLIGTQRYVNGNLAPLIPFVILSDIILSFGYAYLVGMASANNGQYMKNGAIFGFVIVGSYTILNHAILPNWPLSVVTIDILQGIIFGAIVGLVLKKFNNSK